MNETRKRIFSGAQPSGDLTLGNYLGAITSWLAWMEEHQCMFAIMDLHALTTAVPGQSISEKSYQLLASYLACGLDPEKCHIFLQSHVKEHAQLAWYFNCMTPLGDLQRMTQFKSKSQKARNTANAGLLCYPVLMAADILLYQTDAVPVGDDQRQHLELARDIAERFNHHYQKVLTVPEAYMPRYASRVMALQDPSSKMSKSDEQANNYVLLFEDLAVTRRKIMRATTDSQQALDPENCGEGVRNLANIMAGLRGCDPQAVLTEFAGQGYGTFKKALADEVEACLQPMQARFQAISADRAYLDQVLKKGADHARQQAQETLARVEQAIGLLPRG